MALASSNEEAGPKPNNTNRAKGKRRPGGNKVVSPHAPVTRPDDNSLESRPQSRQSQIPAAPRNGRSSEKNGKNNASGAPPSGR